MVSNNIKLEILVVAKVYGAVLTELIVNKRVCLSRDKNTVQLVSHK